MLETDEELKARQEKEGDGKESKGVEKAEKQGDEKKEDDKTEKQHIVDESGDHKDEADGCSASKGKSGWQTYRLLTPTIQLHSLSLLTLVGREATPVNY